MNFALYPTPQPYMPVNHRLAEDYFNSLPPTDVNKKYYEGQQYRAHKGIFNKYLWNRFTTFSKFNTLQKFYPYQKQITETKEEIEEQWQCKLKTAVICTAASWVFLYQYARKGYVLPILREYGSFFKTHRLFRQYAYTLAIPTLWATESLFNQFHDHIEILWIVHVNRLNNKDLSDPYGTEYPDNLRAPRRALSINEWH